MSACCGPDRGSAGGPPPAEPASGGPDASGPPTTPTVPIPAGSFAMGSEDPRWVDPADGEGPVHDVSVAAFAIAPVTVTNAAWAAFADATAYRTEAERYGWSFVFGGLLP